MTSTPVTCREDDDVMNAVKSMANHQVRRIPIVDTVGRLVGIVSQADVARSAQEEQVGEMVEEISQPYGMGEWPEGRYGSSSRSAMSGASALAVGAICVGIGAGLMYMFDPSGGRQRRELARDKASTLVNRSGEAVRRQSAHLKDRAYGLYSDTRSRLQGTRESETTREGDRSGATWSGSSMEPERPFFG
jgi:hypothetical protein